MQNIFAIWISLFACLGVIGFAGAMLSRHADIIAEKAGLSRGWVGLMLPVIYLLNMLFLYLHG